MNLFLYQVHSESKHGSNKVNANNSYCSLKRASMAAVLQNWLNSDMGLLCITLLSFPEAISSVPNISAKDKFKDVLITLLNKFPGILS